ncbi:MAG: hypothetical protein P1R58_06125 [bacterium]|nr:hypothetical protein [bacterium]
MLNPGEKAYCQALLALKSKSYRLAAEEFEKAAPHFKNDREFNLIMETNRVLVAVKKKIAAQESDTIEVEEILPYG